MHIPQKIRTSIRNRLREQLRRWQTMDLAKDLGVKYTESLKLEMLQILATVRRALTVPVDLLVDVGAHRGNFVVPAMQALTVRKALCFEPNTNLHSELRTALTGLDAEIRSCALSDQVGSSAFHMHADTLMSSLLSVDLHMMKREFDFDDISKTSDVRVNVSTLDAEMDGALSPGQHFFLKIDTQGNELNVLRGSRECLRFCNGILLEYMFTSPYVGQASFVEMIAALDAAGFRCAGPLHVIKRPSWLVSGVDFLFLPT